MPKPLTPEQIDALQLLPLGDAPNKLRMALALASARQTDIVEEAGVTASSVSDIVNGKYSSLDIELARKFADFFNCSLEILFPKRAA